MKDKNESQKYGFGEPSTRYYPHHMIHSSKMTDEERVPFAAELSVSSLQRSLDFYVSLGFEVYRIHEETNFAVLTLGESLLMVWQDPVDGPRGLGVGLRFYVGEGLRAFYDNAILKDVAITQPYTEAEYGIDEFYIEDPDGYRVRFCG